jgi:mRNA interferase RelE/StbE
MKIKISKDFQKSVDKLSGKTLSSVLNVLLEVKRAGGIEEITDCKKLVDYDYVYRIRIGSFRAFFIFHIQIVDDMVFFQYLISRGEAYAKKIEKNLRKKDK